MARTMHRTPRHLDDPLRLGSFTLAQWAILIVAIALAWGVLSQLVFVPALWRFVLGGLVCRLADSASPKPATVARSPNCHAVPGTR